MAITVSEAFTALERIKKDISELDGRIELANEANYFFYENWYLQDPERWTTEFQFTVSSGATTATLPTNFERSDLQGTGVFRRNENTNTVGNIFPLHYTSPGSDEDGYFYTGSDTITITPVPTSSLTYILRYIPTLTDMTAETDQFILPGNYRFRRLLVNYLAARFEEFNQRVNVEVNDDARFANLLNEFYSLIRRSPKVIRLPDIGSRAISGFGRSGRRDDLGRIC